MAATVASKGVFTCNEIQAITEIRANIIYY